MTSQEDIRRYNTADVKNEEIVQMIIDFYTTPVEYLEVDNDRIGS